MQNQKVFFNAAGPVLAEAHGNPTELNIARGLVAATEEFKRGCSQEGEMASRGRAPRAVRLTSTLFAS